MDINEAVAPDASSRGVVDEESLRAPVSDLHRWGPGPRVEGHRLIRRSEEERRAPREGRPRPEERHHR